MEAIQDKANTWAQAGNKVLLLLLEAISDLQGTVGSVPDIAQGMVVLQLDVN